LDIPWAGSTNRESIVAEKSMPEREFKVKDKVVCPAQGVGEISDIVDKEIAGKKQKFYVVKLLDTSLKIMIPITSARNIGMRELVNDEQIKVIMTIIAERPPAMDNRTWNRRYRGFMEKIKTGNLFDIAEVYRDLSLLKLDKSLSFGERRMLDLARNLIVKEIAISKKWDEEKVLKEIEKPIRSQPRRSGTVEHCRASCK
jgi:CarD family transcriptional regulator